MYRVVRLYNGVEIPIIAMGTYPLKEELLTLVPFAIKENCRLFDSAWKYQNEKEIGDAVKLSLVEDVFFCSKINIRQLYPFKIHHKLRAILPPLHSVQHCYNESCKRLGRERLNLYLMHYPYPTFKSIWKEMVQLYYNKRVDAIGVCSFTKSMIEELKTSSGVLPMVNQIEMHPYNTNKEILQYCIKNNIKVMAFSPFAGGLLTKKLFSEEILLNIANEVNKSVPQVILRWLIQLGVVPIFRTSSEKRIKENLDVFDFELTLTQMQSIDSLNRNDSVLLVMHGNN